MNIETIYSFAILFAAVITLICAVNLLIRRYRKKDKLIEELIPEEL